jgi:hypothetical protein
LAGQVSTHSPFPSHLLLSTVTWYMVALIHLLFLIEFFSRLNSLILLRQIKKYISFQKIVNDKKDKCWIQNSEIIPRLLRAKILCRIWGSRKDF